MNWKQEIARLALIKSEIKKLDVNGVWPYHLPSVAATETEIQEASTQVGGLFDGGYLDFLRHANGWDGFYQSVNLFGCDDLVGGERMKKAVEALLDIDEIALRQSELLRSELIPIAASDVDVDIFFMSKNKLIGNVGVVWFAGQEIQRFQNFEEFFLAMIDYNLEELRSFVG
ncbi:SMI1/KNR4 family protein [Pseudomonas gingeri]|jgi:hypothetical protein|uniref:SMI1/KNR4 family protein n=1 Tax=Pseudomonas gingeri TaxID=117681 RepID=A0A7Y8BK98_9PSED|nr:SMI1/KNR4 family protein [Pseudomonas gingeri]NWB46393.1 SMI1/KNR4 family protein [Pseudomonas gingeri]